MRIFITGASGFIGSHTARELTGRGHELMCLVRRTSRTDELERLGARLVLGDVQDAAAIGRAAAGADAAVHLANIYSFWEPDPSVYRKVNVDGTRTVLEQLLKAGTPRVVFVSTVEVYGPVVGTFDEDQVYVDPPVSQYANSKRAGELLAWRLHRARGLPLVVLQPTPVLGSGDRSPQGAYLRLLMAGRLPARLAESHVITWVHVRDVAEAIAESLERPGIEGRKYLIGNEQMTIGELNKTAARLARVALPPIALPDALARPAIAAIDAVSRITGRPPAFGFTPDELNSVLHDMHANGSRASRELGISYTPLSDAIADEVKEYKWAARRTSRQSTTRRSRPLSQ